MNRFMGLLITVIAVSVMGGNATGQDSHGHGGGMKVMTFEKGSVHIIQELGAIIVAEDDQLSVQMVDPKDMRPKKYQDVDLRANDKVFMLNGKKLNSIKDLEEGYSKIEIGEDVKFAIKRDDIMMMCSFPKAEPGDQEGTHTMVMKTASELPACQSGKKAAPGVKVVNFDGSGDGITPVLDAGIILTEADGKVKIMALMPHVQEIFKDKSLRDGDIILSLQDEEIKSSAEFSDIFDKIKVGDQVDLRISRDGREMAISFDKPKSPEIVNPNAKN